MKLTRRELLKHLGVLAGVTVIPACTTPTTKTTQSSPPDNLPQPYQNQAIALLGATGLAGGYILNEALVQGYHVRALARTPEKLYAYKKFITVVPGDARDPGSIQELLHGTDVVISAIGPIRSDGRSSMNICSIATDHIITAMRKIELKRYIVVSGAGVTVPGDSRDIKGRLIQTLARLGFSRELEDKQQEYTLLAASTIDWTLIRCPVIDPEAYHQDPVVTLDTPFAYHLNAGELARFIVDQIDSDDYSRKAPFLGSID